MNAANSKAQQDAQAFQRWFSASGHWVYEYRADAVRTWRERGIAGRPAFTQAAAAELAAWVEADPLPAIVQALR